MTATPELVERVARAIYCDGSYPPGVLGANADKWAKTSDVQRQFCRQQARAAIEAVREHDRSVKGASDLDPRRPMSEMW